jgi:hypothetical protein
MSVLASAACGFAIREKRVKKVLCQLGMLGPETRDQVSGISIARSPTPVI